MCSLVVFVSSLMMHRRISRSYTKLLASFYLSICSVNTFHHTQSLLFCIYHLCFHRPISVTYDCASLQRMLGTWAQLPGFDRKAVKTTSTSIRYQPWTQQYIRSNSGTGTFGINVIYGLLHHLQLPVNPADWARVRNELFAMSHASASRREFKHEFKCETKREPGQPGGEPRPTPPTGPTAPTTCVGADEATKSRRKSNYKQVSHNILVALLLATETKVAKLEDESDLLRKGCAFALACLVSDVTYCSCLCLPNCMQPCNKLSSGAMLRKQWMGL
jgi:hypothetical protein